MDFKNLFDFYHVEMGKQGDRYWIFPCCYEEFHSKKFKQESMTSNGQAINCIAFGFIEICFFKFEKYQNYGFTGETLFDKNEINDIINGLLSLKSIWEYSEVFSQELQKNYRPAFQDIDIDFIKTHFWEIKENLIIFINKVVIYLNNIININNHLCVVGL